MNTRIIQGKDYEPIRKALWEAVNNLQGKEWIGSVDLPQAYARIISGEFIALIVEETYLVLADVVTPWYAAPEHKTVAELLVLKVYDGPGEFKDIPRSLQLLAEAVGAGDIVVGTALTRTDRALERMYSRHGFQTSAVEMHLRVR